MAWLRAPNVPSSRTAQQRLFVAFRALPTLLKDLQTALIKTKEGGREGVVSVSDFCDCVRDSNAPVSTIDSVIIAHLLSRGSGGGSNKEAKVDAKSVEIVHLERIKKGELLQSVRV